MSVKIVSTELLGQHSRFKVTEFRSRFNTTVWFVTDAERNDAFGDPAVIAQADTREQALAVALNTI